MLIPVEVLQLLLKRALLVMEARLLEVEVGEVALECPLFQLGMHMLEEAEFQLRIRALE
jgi:hypothetical protein